MKKLLVAVGAVLALSFGLVGLASANNGPHGGYDATTDACAGCHRAHTAQGASLLKETASPNDKSGFCFSCHENGLGAYTDVVNGLFDKTAVVNLAMEDTISPTDSVTASLRGGGFSYLWQNSADSMPGAAAKVVTATSSHTISGSLSINTVWGYGGISTTEDTGAANVTLTCTNCHNPHGGAGAKTVANPTGATYRILKGKGPNTTLFANSTITSVASQQDVTDEVAKTYFIDQIDVGNYMGADLEYFHPSGLGTLMPELSIWCAQCHQRYLSKDAATGDGSNSSGDDVFKFRHRSDAGNPTKTGYGSVPGCLTCHLAHGTGASMGTYSAGVAWPGNVANDPASNSRSSLLRMDNRGVCQSCHNK